jgi:hypothetical protein
LATGGKERHARVEGRDPGVAGDGDLSRDQMKADKHKALVAALIKGEKLPSSRRSVGKTQVFFAIRQTRFERSGGMWVTLRCTHATTANIV